MVDAHCLRMFSHGRSSPTPAGITLPSQIRTRCPVDGYEELGPIIASMPDRRIENSSDRSRPRSRHCRYHASHPTIVRVRAIKDDVAPPALERLGGYFVTVGQGLGYHPRRGKTCFV